MHNFVPISQTYRAQKPLMDENGKRRAARPPPGDLRAATLKPQQDQQPQPLPPCKRLCSEGREAELDSDSRMAGVFLQQHSRDCVEPQETRPTAAMAGEATDFSAFNAMVRSQRQQQQQRAGPGSSRPPRQQVQVTTFDHLTSNQLGPEDMDPASQIEGIRSLYGVSLLRSGFGVAAAGAAVPSAAAGNGTAAAAAGSAQYDHCELPGAPWDWALKARVRVASPQPLACLRAAAAAGLAPSCRAVAGGGLAPFGAPTAAAGPELAERLQRALLQWQHPAQALAADVLRAIRIVKAGTDMLAARAREWRDSLRGLHVAVRNGQCPVAYVVGAQLFNQPLSILLLAPGIIASGGRAGSSGGGGSDISGGGLPEHEPAAVVSRSNRQLRVALDAVGASYTMAATAAAGNGKQQRHEQLSNRLQATGGEEPRAQAQLHSADGRAVSQLLVRGARGVQALHLLLLQQPWCTGEDGSDVPVLLAPAPFVGATLCPCFLKELPAASVPAGRRAFATGPHYAEIGGGAAGGGVGSGGGAAPAATALVAPWTLCRLAAVLRDSQTDFEIFADAEPTSSSLNPTPALGAAWLRDSGGGGDAAATPIAAPANVGVSELELRQWASGARLLAGRHVRQLRFGAGAFSVRLGAP